jgi:CIC family chloride channel protein
VPASTIPGKFLACAVSIGCGNSLGPEDPALQMGAGVASLIGRVFKLPRDYRRVVAPIGAAAGIAAAFNTPITGVLFVIEEVIGSWNASVMGSILLSAVSAVVVSRWYLGDEPLFRVPALAGLRPADLIVYAAIGIICGLGAAAYVRLLLWLKRHGDHWTSHTARLAMPGLAGLCVGVMGFWLPQVEGPGYLTIDNALHGRFGWSQLLLLAAAKMAATTLCFGAGTPGGLFAPTLFVGAMIGGGIGVLAQQHWLLPHAALPVAAPAAFVLVGMGTFRSWWRTRWATSWPIASVAPISSMNWHGWKALTFHPFTSSVNASNFASKMPCRPAERSSRRGPRWLTCAPHSRAAGGQPWS